MTNLRPLTDRDWEVLGDLVSQRWDSRQDYTRKRAEGGLAPIDFGGTNDSHHGKTATKLVGRGFVEHRKRGCDWGQAPTRYRGSKVYRATEAGRAAWEEHKKAKKA